MFLLYICIVLISLLLIHTAIKDLYLDLCGLGLDLMDLAVAGLDASL